MPEGVHLRLKHSFFWTLDKLIVKNTVSKTQEGVGIV